MPYHCPHAPPIVTPRPSWLLLGALLILAALVLSGWQPFDRVTWMLEVLPVLLALPVLLLTHPRYPLTSLLYSLIFLHALVLIVGGAYSYARVPLGFYLADLLHLERNPYDKIGHFFQGLVPVLVAREILLRGHYLQRGKMLVFLLLCIVLAISASYELLEWASAVVLGQGAEEFLGTQGDPWDTQSDMLFALLGSICSLVLLSHWHDQQLRGHAPDSAAQ